MPTIEDIVIREVQKCPTIYNCGFGYKVDNKKHFVAIAKKINNRQINGAVVKEIWDAIFLEFTRNINLEEEYQDCDRNDPNYPEMNATRMSQLAFLRPYLYNPSHQISTMNLEVSMPEKSCDCGERGDQLAGTCTRPSESNDRRKLVLPPFPAPQEDDSEMFVDEEESEKCFRQGLDTANLQQLYTSSDDDQNGQIRQQQLDQLFERVDKNDRAECFLAVIESLKQLAAQQL